jgi:hypothetical protein
MRTSDPHHSDEITRSLSGDLAKQHPTWSPDACTAMATNMVARARRAEEHLRAGHDEMVGAYAHTVLRQFDG